MIEDLKKLLENQRILIISPKYFGYQERIIGRLRNLNSAVVWLDNRPDNSFITKAVMRYFPYIYKDKINSYYKKSITAEFDQVLFINPEYLTAGMLRSIRKLTGAPRCILYMWDSFLNKNKLAGVLNHFDKVLTFDPDDAQRHNLFFRPLFFSSGKQTQKEHQTVIDISFVGTGHSDRAGIIERIKKQCVDLHLKYFFYLYLQNHIVYYFHKLLNKNFRGIKKSGFNYTPLDYNEYIGILENSRAVIDVEHPKQKGLTMRVFETQGKGKKLITANSNIKTYDFYNDANICIIDRSNPVIDKEFIDADYQPLPVNLYYKYSIDGWLEDIFSIPE
jgi:hypothetical protein